MPVATAVSVRVSPTASRRAFSGGFCAGDADGGQIAVVLVAAAVLAVFAPLTTILYRRG